MSGFQWGRFSFMLAFGTIISAVFLTAVFSQPEWRCTTTGYNDTTHHREETCVRPEALPQWWGWTLFAVSELVFTALCWAINRPWMA